jgi:hypothetical protein
MSFTEAVAAYLNKQISELAIAQQKQVGTVGTSPENHRRQAWIDKWDYS